jgi:hypothetical protein
MCLFYVVVLNILNYFKLYHVLFWATLCYYKL